MRDLRRIGLLFVQAVRAMSGTDPVTLGTGLPTCRAQAPMQPNSLQRILMCDWGQVPFREKVPVPRFDVQEDGCSVATDLPLGETGNSLKASCFEKQGLLPLLL